MPSESHSPVIAHSCSQAESAPPEVAAQLSNLQARAQTQHKDATASTPSTSTALPAKLAKNKRLPATMITPAGSVDSKKKGGKRVGKKQRKRTEEGKEKALERSGKLEEKVKGREERKVRWDQR